MKTEKKNERPVYTRLVLLVSVVIVLGVLSIKYWIPWHPSGKEENPTIKIGTLLPLSGSLAFMGKMEGDGMKLAVKDINASGGINGQSLELRFDDTQGKPDIAVTAVQRMMELEQIKIVVASFSSVVLGIQSTVKNNGGLLIGTCMHPDFYKNDPNSFRFYIGVEDESRGFVDYINSVYKSDPNSRVGLLYVDAPNVTEQIDDYIEPELSAFGLSFSVKESYRLSDKEFRDKILKIRTADITHLLIIGYGFLYPNIFQELRAQKMLDTIQVIGGWGFLYPNLPADDLEGVIVVGPNYVFDQGDSVQDFYTRFKSEFGYEANFDAAMTYMAFELLSKGLKTINRDDINLLSNHLRNLRDVPTILGKVNVNPSGSVSFDVGIGMYHLGRIHKLEQ